MADGAGVPCVRRLVVETPQHRDLKPLVSPGVASGQACDVAGQASPQARRATLQGRHRLRPSLNPVASPKATGKSRPGVTSGQACDVAGQASLQARHARRQASFLWPGNSPVAKHEPSVKWPTVRVSPALGVRLFIYLWHFGPKSNLGSVMNSAIFLFFISLWFTRQGRPGYKEELLPLYIPGFH